MNDVSRNSPLEALLECNGHAIVPAALTSVGFALAHNTMEAQVPGPAIRLHDLPTEVLGVICRNLNLKERVCLSITCRAILDSLVSSEDAWGTLEFTDVLPVILPWLAHRRQGLRRLELSLAFSAFLGSGSQAEAELVTYLEGSPLVQFKLVYMNLSEGVAALQWLGSCTTLTSLSLKHCQLGCLPGALELLPALAELSLASNQLGEASWGRLRQLTTLTWLGLDNCGLDALPAELAALPALAALNLQRNIGLGAAGVLAWEPLAQCRSLTSLDLGYMHLNWLPVVLAALVPCLVDLSLECNDDGDLWAAGQFTLRPLCRLTGLTRLNLSECLVYFPHLPEALSCLVALQDLNLSGGGTHEEGLTLHLLRHLTALTRLDLSSCCLENLPSAISHLQSLQELAFAYNPLDLLEDVSWHHLCRLTALRHFDLEGCGLRQLPPELARLHSLVELNLCCNELLHVAEGESPATTAANWAALEHLTGLTCLDASDCELHAVPIAFAALSRLRVLRLAGNPLGRGGVEALRPLVSLTALRHLDMSRCCLPRELERDAIPFPLHRLEGWAERIKGLSEVAVRRLVVE